MKINIQALDFKPRKTLTSFVEACLGKLEVLNSRIVDTRVILRLTHSTEKNDKVCEIQLTIPGSELFVSKKSDTFEEAILKSVDGIKHQLSRMKSSKLHSVDQSSFFAE